MDEVSGTDNRAERAVTDDAKSQATRWTRLRDVVPSWSTRLRFRPVRI
jgi:hypothetical protein